MRIRIITALVGMPIILAALYYGKLWLLTFVLAVIILGMKEYHEMMSDVEINIIIPLSYAIAILFPVATYFDFISPQKLFVMAFVVVAIFYLVFYKRQVKDCAMQLFGIYYLSSTFSCVLIIRAMENGFRYLLLTFLFIWMSDTAAYFVGRFIGRHKLAPFISPNKTVEGSLGGLVFTIIFAIVVALYFKYSISMMIFLAIVVNVFAQLGDLAESAIKRQAKIKDSGTLLPGHGGVMDRFDSAFFAIPAVYLLLSVYIK
jgi:phosphatidate cytidylyltransferase